MASACFITFSQSGPGSATAAPRKAYTASSLYRIAGNVVNGVTGEPVRHATVDALTEEDTHAVASAESDDEGRFLLEGLAAAKYQLTASKRGFRTAFFDEHEDFSTAIVTGPGQETEKLTFRLTPGATLRGVITTEGGDPVEGANVMLFEKPRPNDSAGRITHLNDIPTDDTGAYEFNGLAAGEYLVAVKADPWYALHRSGGHAKTMAIDDTDGAAAENSPIDVAYPVTFFDGTTEDELATAITLSGGSRVEANITLHAMPALRLLLPTSHTRQGASEAIVMPVLRQLVFGTEIPSDAPLTPDAGVPETVEYTGIAPGHYELLQGNPPRIAELDATTSQQVDPSLGTATMPVTGTLRNIAGASLASRDGVTIVTATQVDGTRNQSPLQTTGDHGAFRFPGVPAGVWELAAQDSGRQLAVVSITVGNRAHAGDQFTVGDRPQTLAVTVSENSTRIDGFACRSGAPGDKSSSPGCKNGKGVAGTMVVLVPKDLTAIQGLARRDQSDSDGSFTLRDVASGQYTVVAIQDGWELDWSRPEVIARYLPGGISVTVTDSSGKLLSLSAPVPVETRQP
jgi:hypothetical protein